METSTETTYLSPKADSVFKQILPLLLGLSFNDVKDVAQEMVELAEKNCVFKIVRPDKESDPKAEPKKDLAAAIEEMVAEIKQKFKDAGINGEIIVERIPKIFNPTADLIEQFRNYRRQQSPHGL